MNTVSSPLFEKQFKRLVRKYPSLIEELERFEEEVHLLIIYDKSERESISDKDLKILLKSLSL